MRKRTLTIAMGAILASWIAGPTLAAEDNEPGFFIAHPLTGVAIEGYDPVSFFTEGEPQRGSAQHEFFWAGRPWYFANAANRDVFMRAPEVYAPRLGGHCAMSLSRGYLSEGDPRLYAVHGQRLYLFYSVGNREAFLLAPAETSAQAEARWVELRADLPRP